MTHQYVFDYHDGDIYWCTADVGWVTGHTYIVYGPLANGAVSLMFEGVPNYPDASRFWQVVDKHKVNIFYTAPTAIRALMRDGEGPVRKTSRRSLRILGSVGEPINPEAWLWYDRVVGEHRAPAARLDSPPPLLGRLTAPRVRNEFLGQRIHVRHRIANHRQDAGVGKQRAQPRQANGVVRILVQNDLRRRGQMHQSISHRLANLIGGVVHADFMTILAAGALVDRPGGKRGGREHGHVTPEVIAFMLKWIDARAGLLQQARNKRRSGFLHTDDENKGAVSAHASAS
jgi:hypothetical protein